MPKVLAPYLPRRAIEKRIFLFLHMEQNTSFSRRKKAKNDKKMCVFSPVRFPKIYKNRVENTFSEKWKKSEKFHILKIFLFSKKKIKILKIFLHRTKKCEKFVEKYHFWRWNRRVHRVKNRVPFWQKMSNFCQFFDNFSKKNTTKNTTKFPNFRR